MELIVIRSPGDFNWIDRPTKTAARCSCLCPQRNPLPTNSENQFGNLCNDNATTDEDRWWWYPEVHSLSFDRMGMFNNNPWNILWSTTLPVVSWQIEFILAAKCPRTTTVVKESIAAWSRGEWVGYFYFCRDGKCQWPRRRSNLMVNKIK